MPFGDRADVHSSAARASHVRRRLSLRRPASDAGARGLGSVDSRGSFAGADGARTFIDSAPLGEQAGQGRAKLGHLNAERILVLRTA